MKKGPGCAVMLFAVLLLLVMSNEMVELVFTRCDQGDDFFECITTAVVEEPEEGQVAAVGTYTYEEYSITVTANIPLQGGAVSGSFSGDCNGNVKGTYNAQTGVISGRMHGVCSVFLANVPAGADYTGSVNKAGKTVPVSFNGEGGGIKHEGALTLTYQ